MNAYIKDDIMILEINYYSMEGKSTDCQQLKRKKERTRIGGEIIVIHYFLSLAK